MHHTTTGRSVPALLTATLGLILLLAPAAAAQEGTVEGAVGEEEIVRFTRAYAEVEAIREDFQEEFGRTHNTEALAELRTEMNERIREVLREHELPEEEYDRIHFAIMTDPDARETFQALLDELEARVEE